MGEAFDLRDDGTARLAWDEHDVTLRRPKLREYRSFLEEQGTAMVAMNEKVIAGADGEGLIRDVDMIGPDGEPGPFLKLYARIFTELGGQDIDPFELPIWMTSGRVFSDLVVHWRNVPLAPGTTTSPPPTSVSTTTTENAS